MTCYNYYLPLGNFDMKSIASILLALSLSGLPATAEFRTFVSTNGQAMKAELVSHTKGKVTIRREDGKQFEVNPAIFCKQDHEAILEWMKSEPETINYDFDVDVDKKMRGRESHGEGSSETSWVHEVRVRNDAQSTVTGIRVLYRVFHESWGETHMVEGDYLLEQDLDFNRTLVVTTDAVTIWRSRESRNGIKGVLVRILDPKGKVVTDWVSKDAKMKDVTWENTTPRDHCEEPEERAVIR